MNPNDVDNVECLCEPHYNEPDQVACSKLPTVSKLLDKAEGALDSSDLSFAKPLYPYASGGVTSLAFTGQDFGATEKSRITNSNQTWVFAAQMDPETIEADGILAYGDRPQVGTFEFSAGDSSFNGNLRITKRGVGSAGFVPVVEGTSFKIWGKGGKGHGEALIYYDGGIRKWIWHYYEEIDRNGQHQSPYCFYVGDKDGNRNMVDGEYVGGWSLPYGQFDDPDIDIDLYIHFNRTDVLGRSSNFDGRLDVPVGANASFNVYSIEFDRELYLLNFYVNGVNTVSQGFAKNPLAENQRILVFADLTASLKAEGRFAELLVLPYIDQNTRKGVESYLGNKWNIPILNPATVAPDFNGPVEPKGRSEVVNFYPPTLEDKPSSSSVFVLDEGLVAGGPSANIWLSQGGSSSLTVIRPDLPSHATSISGGIFWWNDDVKTGIGWIQYRVSDMVFVQLVFQYYQFIYIGSSLITQKVIKKGGIFFDINQPDASRKALEQSRHIFKIGTPDYRRFYPVSWASDPFDPARITHKVSGFNDYRDGYYAKINNELGAYVYFRHNRSAWLASQYRTYRTYDGEFTDQFSHFISGFINEIDRDLVENDEVFYRYEKIAELDCSLPQIPAYIYSVMTGMDDDVYNLNNTVTISSKLGSENVGGYHVDKNQNSMDSLSDDDGVFPLQTVEEVTQACSSVTPIVPLITIRDDVENFSYNTSIVNGDLVLEEVSGDHFRKTFNGNICILSAKYQSGEEPLSLDDNGLRGFYHVGLDQVDYHRRGEDGYVFEGAVKRLVREPRLPDLVNAGHQVKDPLDVDCFIISDDVSNVSAELDYDYEFHDEITGTPSWANYFGWVSLSNDGLRMVTTYGSVYARDGIGSGDQWYSIGSVTGNVSVGSYLGDGCKISGDGQYIVKSYGGIHIYRIYQDQTISKVSEIDSPYPANLHFSSYFGGSIDISRDGKYIAVGASYSNGVEGTRSFEGIFYIYEKQSNGTYEQSRATTPINLRGQDFGLKSGFGRNNVRYGCNFSPNGERLIFSCDSVAYETYRTPVMVLEPGTNKWTFKYEALGTSYKFGGFVEIDDVYGIVHTGTRNSVQHFAHTDSLIYSRKEMFPASRMYVSNMSLQRDGRVAIQSNQARHAFNGIDYYPRPQEINVFRSTPHVKREARTIKNNYYYNPNNHYRTTQTGDYTFRGPMNLAGLQLQSGNLSELYIFAENKLNVLRLDQTTL
jgi:hypothetical protein